MNNVGIITRSGTVYSFDTDKTEYDVFKDLYNDGVLIFKNGERMYTFFRDGVDGIIYKDGDSK